MSYTPPAGNAIDFNFSTSYTPTAGNTINYNFSDSTELFFIVLAAFAMLYP